MTADPHATIARHAADARRRLPETMLPYWLAVSRDDEAGGYLLHDDVRRNPIRRVGRVLLQGARPRPSDDKQLVTQARLLWVFSHAHQKGFDDGTVYVDAATRGYRFLRDHFRDPERDGYRWMTDRYGQPVNDVKLFYGQAFVIYGLVEYARASGTCEPLADALALFRAVEHELHDDRYGGWREQADGDWSALADDDPRIEMPFAGRRSGNAVVHWLEALTQLYADTADPDVRRALVEALDLGGRHLFPADPGRTREPCLPDWTPDPASEHLMSYGHNVEYAWLMLRAQEVLDLEPDRDRFHAYLDHTLRVGFDHRRGGVYTWGHGDEPAHRRHKTWWVQCELIAALTDALTVRHDERYAGALAQTLDFVERHMTDRRDGILLDSVQEDGRRRWPRKSGNWKAGYHDVRAAVKLAEGFAP
jgi:mannose/cellobiose epimerase-like protein (N-acyl-D-glucosamine 2-epimerase family)